MRHTERVGFFQAEDGIRDISIGNWSSDVCSSDLSFLMATPEKALCDLIANSPNVNLRYLKDVEAYLEGDIRMDIDEFLRMDVGVFERYAQVGKKGKSIETLIKYMKK